LEWFPQNNMTHNIPPRVVRRRGITLLELTVVITVLLTLISILFIGARGWKSGSDRASCVLTLRNMQVAARSYQNLYGYDYGGQPYVVSDTQNIARHLYEKGYIERPLFDRACGTAKCPGGGFYTCPKPDYFPTAGALYMICSFAGPDAHTPSSHTDW